MSDILKEAIADAKAVRETALQNAKMALEEAFTPQLKSMLSAKLKEEEDEESAEEMAYETEEEPEEMMSDEDEVEEGDYEEMADMDETEEEPEEMMSNEEEDEIEDMMSKEEGEDEVEETEDEEDAVAETLEINGRTYRLAEEEDEEGEEVNEEEEEEVEESNLELEAIIKELEDEMDEDEDEDEVKEEIEKEKTEYEENTSDGHEENVDGDKDEKHVGGDIGESVYEIDSDLLEQSDSSEIGKGDNKVDYADSGDEEDPGANDDKPGDKAAGNIGESYKKVNAELKEYKEAVKFLKDKLHEVNILNAKLLFTNKLFKEYVLDNNQKLRVVETFDRAQTVREIKLIFSTLAESFKNGSSVKTKKSIKESASRKSGSTKPNRKIISEEVKVADRFKKLAGLIR